MELPDDRDELIRAAKLFHDFPQAFSADRVESLLQVDEGHEKFPVMLVAVFLELACSKYHVCCYASCTKPH